MGRKFLIFSNSKQLIDEILHSLVFLAFLLFHANPFFVYL